MKKVIQLFVCLSLVAVLCSCGPLSALSIGLTTLYEDSRMPYAERTYGNKGRCNHVVAQHPHGHPCIHSTTLSTTDPVTGALSIIASGPLHESDPCDHGVPLHLNAECVLHQ